MTAPVRLAKSARPERVHLEGEVAQPDGQVVATMEAGDRGEADVLVVLPQSRAFDGGGEDRGREVCRRHCMPVGQRAPRTLRPSTAGTRPSRTR